MQAYSLLGLLPFAYADAYDKMQAQLIKAKENLTKILTSKDVKATVCKLMFAVLYS